MGYLLESLVRTSHFECIPAVYHKIAVLLSVFHLVTYRQLVDNERFTC